MKQLIVPIAVIVALIVFFVNIEYRDFSCRDDVQTVQCERTVSALQMKPETNVKSTVETKPVAETKSAEAKSAAAEKELEIRAKPEPVAAINRPAPVAVPVFSAEEALKANEDALRLHLQRKTIEETKEAKIVAETTIEDKPVPMAIPVLTPEEAIKANREAIRFQRKQNFTKAFQSFICRIGLNSNRIHFILSLLPLLLIFDILLFKKKKKHSSKVFDYISLSRRIRILFSVSLLAFGILVFVPWSVYFGNSLQFPFIFQDFVNWNLRVLTISIVGASIILLLIPPIVSDYLVAIISGLGLCVYVQAMFMNQHLGTMDGTEPNWSEHRVFGTINLIIWIAIVLSPVILRKIDPLFFSKVLSAVTGIVLFLEIIATASMCLSAGQDVWVRQDTYFVDSSKLFQLSKEKNVVLFVFDSLGSGFVKKCFEDYPEAKKIVKDFTWYTDARSNYESTFLGLTSELTGTLFSEPVKNFNGIFEGLWQSPAAKSFYKQISDAGYDIRLYCASPKHIIGPQVFYRDYFSNIQKRDTTYLIDYRHLHICLEQMSGFSSAPYFFKSSFFYTFDFSDDVVQRIVDGISSTKSSIESDNRWFLKKMDSAGLSFDADKPVYSIIYMRGVHPPFKGDEKLNGGIFDEPTPTTRGCFYFLSKYIDYLKAAGNYDNTAILVCSDHGGKGDRRYSTLYDMTIMLKPFQENKTELTIDDSEAQALDILPTLLEIACGNEADFTHFEGVPLFRIPHDRIRKVYRFCSQGLPDPGPEIKRTYADIRGFEEYNFVDLKTFRYGKDSEFFVRHIPFISANNKK